MKKYLLFALVAFLAVTSASAQMRIRMGKNSPIEKLGRAEIAIANLYVDSVDENKLVEDAIRGMLEKLDPHSSYTTAKETQAMNESLNGSFDGIGVQFNMVDDSLLVIQPVVNGPSEKVGIIAGDRIVAVNDTAIAGVKMSKEEIMKRLRGPKGTIVNLTVVRRGIKDKLSFRVKRDKIPVTTMDAAYMIRPGIGYIRLGSFGMTSHKEVSVAMDSLKKKGMKDLIFDLQDNGGGYLQTAAKIANEFLEKGDLIVYTNGRTAPRQEFRAEANGRWRKGKLVVLTNEFSASAAEIVSGAIQDQDRGVVVGRRTFGKGLVQRPLTFEDGSEIRLTIALYAERPMHPEALQERRARGLCHGSRQPLQARRVHQPGQHPSVRLSEVLHPAQASCGLWRRRHHARLFRAARYDQVHQDASLAYSQEHRHQPQPEVHRRPSPRAEEPVQGFW